ncbi:MAG: 1-(5-phosphoribosyl)-5-[(5-phosphoribosylamino)methylideneamino]imidazole-4-carboxamide isomerase [Oscillospiraceae bacterium]|nr:1-(5-phosphoribosyl)-5-[(5-phosphoribosylamino)methylideneamino]imidazole-4-carboxamide isomerase [Oscillospiraceae bacterium]
MILYPAIDLYDGMAVRLRQGRYDDMTVYDRDPESLALRMREAGATHLHMVDLEGARSGSTANLALIEKIASATGLFIELGGGIRSMETVRRYLDCGISRAILGTAAAENEEFLREALETFGAQIAVGVDLKDGFVAVRGWEEKSSWTAEAFFRHLTELKVRTVICTDISRDGVLAGSNHDLYASLNERYPIDLIASGGVSSLEDIRGLRALGMSGAILGRAYYSGTVTLEDALAAAAGDDRAPDGMPGSAG